MGKGASYLISEVTGNSKFLKCVLGVRHFTSIPSILSKNYMVDNLFSSSDEETKTQRACQVTSKCTGLLRTGTLDLNPRSICLLGLETYHSTTWLG